MTLHSATSSSALATSFLLGVATAVTANVVLRNLGRYSKEKLASEQNGHGEDESTTPTATLTTERSVSINSRNISLKNNSSNSNNNTRQAQSNDLLDSPDLDLRLIRKAEAVIRFRSGNLTVVIERSTNSWNHSACLRTAEALGIQNVWIVDPAACLDENFVEDDDGEVTARDKKNKLLQLSAEEIEQRRQHHLFAQNATEWLTIREFENTSQCISALRETGHQIYVTDLSQKAVELTPDALEQNGRWPLPPKMAIVFGTEAVGCSDEMLQAADLRVYLPLRGFADSLNLSVAAALVIHHLLLLEPHYVASMTNDEQKDLRKQWFPKLARQRLLASKEKKRRRKLQFEVNKCEKLKAQKDSGRDMTREQLTKIEKLEAYRQEILELERQANFDMSDQIIQDLIESPPDPLSDLRRADAHRISFAGKNIKRENADHWKGLAGMTGVETTKLSTAGFFRERMEGLRSDGNSSTDHE